MRAATEMAVRQLRFALEKLAELHGDPQHIGCGMRRTDDHHTLFVYFTNPGNTYPEEIAHNEETVFMFHYTGREEVKRGMP